MNVYMYAFFILVEAISSNITNNSVVGMGLFVDKPIGTLYISILKIVSDVMCNLEIP